MTRSAPSLNVDLFRGYSPHPKAWGFFQDDARFVLACAGRRSAKTHTGARRFLRKVYDDLNRNLLIQPGDPLFRAYETGAARRGTALWWDRRPRLHYWIAAHESEQLDEPKRYLLQFLPRELLEHADNSKGRMWLRPDILVEFKSLHDAKQKVGSGLDGIWIEEAARVSPTAWEGFIQYMLSDRKGWAQFTTTPLGEDWTYDQIFKRWQRGDADQGDTDYSFHRWFMSDNIRVPEIVADAARLKLTLPPTYYKRECEASYDAFEGQIYEHFNDKMCVDEVPAGLQFYKRFGCQDWGFTAPGAQVVLGMTSVDVDRAHIWAIDEVYDSSRLVEDFWVPSARALSKQYTFNDWVADPAEPDNIDRMKKAGVRMVGHKNYTSAKFDEHERSVRAGIRAMSSLMYQNRFHVLRRCKNLISELKSYRWDSNREGKLQESPAPGQKEHAATACRYGVTHALRGAKFVSLGA